MVQYGLSRPVSLVCGTHYLVSEVLKSRPEVNLLNPVDETPSDSIDDKLKKFEDDDDADHEAVSRNKEGSDKENFNFIYKIQIKALKKLLGRT